MKNLKNYIIHEDDDIVAPKKTRMRWNVDKNNNIKDSWEDRWDKTHHNDKYFSYCDRIDALLEKSIGRPYSEVYNKVLEMPNLLDWGTSLRDYFHRQFRPYRRRCYIENHYYVDEDGNIQRFENERKRTRRPAIIRFNHDRQPEYHVNRDAVVNNDMFMNYIYYKCVNEFIIRCLIRMSLLKRCIMKFVKRQDMILV